MGTFGENLRRERELRGITLAELANGTKISRRHLQALEADQFEHLPGGVFNRGFVRAIARYMNLDENYWVGEYARAAQEEPEILARYAPPASPRAGTRQRAWRSFVLLLLVFGAGAYGVHQVRVWRAAEAASPITPPPILPPGRGSAENSTPPEGFRPTAAATGVPAATPAARPRQPPVDLHLQVDVLQDAWVTVTVDSQPLYRGLMRPGESRSFRGGRRIELSTGNASAVVLTLNGETLAPLGNPGERKNIVLTAKDLRPPAP